MNKIVLASWNVNGIRACLKNGFLDWLNGFKPDILCIQETRVDPTLIPQEFQDNRDYSCTWLCAKQRGYSGVAIFVKNSLNVSEFKKGMNIEEFDREGRTLTAVINDMAVVNCYFPNSQHEHARLNFKLEYNKAISDYLNMLKRRKLKVIICGDFNVAHREIDLKNPKANENNPGFLPEEREWMTHFLSSGYIDTFRYFYPDLTDQYTWWTYRGNAREKNIGWRVDYFCAHENTKENLISTGILNKVKGSDHCPITLEIKI